MNSVLLKGLLFGCLAALTLAQDQLCNQCNSANTKQSSIAGIPQCRCGSIGDPAENCRGNVGNIICRCRPGYTDNRCNTQHQLAFGTNDPRDLVNLECENVRCNSWYEPAATVWVWNPNEPNENGQLGKHCCPNPLLTNQQPPQQFCPTAQCSTVGGVCNEQQGRCDCFPGYTGSRCENPITQATFCETNNQCQTFPNTQGCDPNVQTQQGVGACFCVNGYTGRFCSNPPTQATFCQQNQCQGRLNTQGCDPNLQGGQGGCICSNGFTGRFCDNPPAQTRFCETNNQCQGFPNSQGCDPNALQGQGGCFCINGYSGQFCTNPPTQTNFCQQNNQCQGRPNTQGCNPNLQGGQGGCICVNGYSGQFCGNPPSVGEEFRCDLQRPPCQNGGTCRWDNVRTWCVCPAGFNDFPDCAGEIIFCTPGKCLNGGICLENEDRCDCPGGFTGTNCGQVRVCQNSFCSNQGNCRIDAAGREVCDCFVGFFGDRCQTTVVDACAPNPCENGGVCTEITDTTYVCSCPNDQFIGDRCQTRNWCLGHSCSANGVCVNEQFNFRCECSPDYTGNLCDQRDFCQDRQCNGRGDCINSDIGGVCSCNVGYRGDNCEHDDPCVPNPCGFLVNEQPNNPQNDGICYEDPLPNDPTRSTFVCDCPRGWGNFNCETSMGLQDACYDDDVNRKCQNGGVCRSWYNPDVAFTNPNISPYWFTCFCINGYSGDTCETRSDPCLNNPCGPQGTCVDAGVTNPMTGEAYTCRCNQGYRGERCSELDFCNPNQCASGSTCVNGDTDFTCFCRPGTTGVLCDEIDACATGDTVCRNGGTCRVFVGFAICDCPDEWAGDDCSDPVNNQCPNTNFCQNLGSCVVVNNSPVCQCIPGFSGNRCQFEIEAEDLPCDSNPCLNNPIKCNNLEDDTDFSCECRYPWGGRTCADNFGTTRPTRPPIRTTRPGPRDPGDNVKQSSGDDDDDLPLSTGVIVAIAIAGIALLVGIIRLLAYCCCQWGRRKR